ncbi:hypothetical protein Tco_1571500 [Tanacetum coccineum]
MLNKKLQADYWNEMCYQLLKLMIQKMNIKFRGGLLGLKDFKMILRVTTAQYCTAGTKVNAAGLQMLEDLLFGPNGPSQVVCVGSSGSNDPNIRSRKRKRVCTIDDSQGSSSIVDAHDKGNSCPWVLYLAKDKISNNWEARTHIDTYKFLQSEEIKHCTYNFMAKQIFNPNILVKVVQDQLQVDLELQISMSKALRAKAKAETKVKGDHTLQYVMLRDHVVELQSTNPNTIVKIAVERKSDRLDGAFMKRSFPGQVLAAVGLDANNRIYLLAYALVKAKSIIPAIKVVFTSAEHKFCLRHIHKNTELAWSGQAYKDGLWRCALATIIMEFKGVHCEEAKAWVEIYEWKLRNLMYLVMCLRPLAVDLGAQPHGRGLLEALGCWLRVPAVGQGLQWGRSSFAQCLIEINADDVLKESLTMGIPLFDGSSFSIETAQIEYEWKPP